MGKTKEKQSHSARRAEMNNAIKGVFIGVIMTALLPTLLDIFGNFSLIIQIITIVLTTKLTQIYGWSIYKKQKKLYRNSSLSSDKPEKIRTEYILKHLHSSLKWTLALNAILIMRTCFELLFPHH